MERMASALPPRVHLVASGDQREAANRTCWPAQAELEGMLEELFRSRDVELVKVTPYEADKGHGFIHSQRQGLDVLRALPDGEPVVVVVAAWQYSHHVLGGLLRHRGPLLTVANWSGTWPGLVGLLNLNACLRKAGREYSTFWSLDFEDDITARRLDEWLRTGRVTHDLSHVRPLVVGALGGRERVLGEAVAVGLRERGAVIGVFDEGCMGMSNAIVDDALLNPLGIFKERLSQSALLAEARTVADEDAAAVIAWLRTRGMRFETGSEESQHLTEGQLIEQARMYVAALRIADRFGCDAVGIQYQQGLKDMAPASDLVEGLLNDNDRPPARRADGSVIRKGRSLPHFNEVDECAAVDALVTDEVWRRLGLESSNTLHDLRWGEEIELDGESVFLWTLQISGAVPATHLDGGYAGAVGYRQPPMYFPLGGSTLAGTCKPGEIVWSRVFQEDGALHVDIGRGRAVRVPEAENERRRRITTFQWPIMHTVLYGVTRDQMMARHAANHIHVAYAPTSEQATSALEAKAAAFDALGIRVHLCGDVSRGASVVADSAVDGALDGVLGGVSDGAA